MLINYRHKGFSLIELLVSVVILVSVISVISVIYRGALLSSDKATDYVVMSGHTIPILKEIRADLRNMQFSIDNAEGSGSSNRVEYNWTSEVVEQDKVVGIAGGSESYNEYKLWVVTLEMTFNSAKREYQFFEVSWKYE
ncbi:hypothetical protein CWC18_01430 [Pseudoalteromonas aurantia]|nr:prepilin-type N-terminal cleavage/methylation domain-containing protein [Pseudoalteromonas aurantia]TMO67097.1 hypothetical protein CWC18_01430 [Pseudoalteromonas aurantia]